jgi:predicted murein hydrolase (TIGR00659 family)
MADRVLPTLLAIAATLAVYAAAQRLYVRARSPLLNPVLVSAAVLIALLRWTGTSVAAYNVGGQWITYWLGPAVVALGVPLYLQMDEIARRGRAVLVSIAVGSLVGIVTAVGVAAALGASRRVVLSLAPRSVTTPIAMGISEKLGGLPSLSAALVIATGVVGAVAGPALLRAAGIRSRTAFGLAMGAAAHGVGTARAVEEGEVEGATSGLAIGLMGLATAILAPVVVALLERICTRC